MARNPQPTTPRKTRSSTSASVVTPRHTPQASQKARASRSPSVTIPQRPPCHSSPRTPSSPTTRKAALWGEFRALARSLAAARPPVPPLCNHKKKAPLVRYLKNTVNDGRMFTICFVSGCKFLKSVQYLTEPLAPNVLAFLNSQRPPEGSPARSQGAWRPPATRTHYLPLDEPTSKVIARRILELRGEPAGGADVDEYIYCGQDVSDESDNDEDDFELPRLPAPTTSTTASHGNTSASDDDHLWNSDIGLPFWKVVAYLEDGRPPVDYKLEKRPFTLLRDLFMETFALTSYDVIAYHASSAPSWVITYIKDLKYSALDLPGGGTLV